MGQIKNIKLHIVTDIKCFRVEKKSTEKNHKPWFTSPKTVSYHTFTSMLYFDVILEEIKKDVLPSEDIDVPEWELPANDQDGTMVGESIKEKIKSGTLSVSMLRN